jgi:hypothetical protein
MSSLGDGAITSAPQHNQSRFIWPAYQVHDPPGIGPDLLLGDSGIELFESHGCLHHRVDIMGRDAKPTFHK